MRTIKASIAGKILLFAASSAIAIVFIYYQTVTSTNKAVNELFAHYGSLIEKQAAQGWFRTAIELDATYAAERQLLDFSDDFFDEGIIHRQNTILGGFGNLVGKDVPQPHILQGLFSAEGFVYFRVLVKASISLTFRINDEFIKKKFPTVASYSVANNQLSISTSALKTIKEEISSILILVSFLVVVSFSSVFFASSYQRIKSEIQHNELKNHDIRVNDFNNATISYRVKNYLSLPNEKNRMRLVEEISNIDLTAEINRRIFACGKKVENQIFNLSQEINKVVEFVGLETNLDLLKISPCSGELKVKCDINAFSVLLLNLLKNALREVNGKPHHFCYLSVLEAPNHVEVILGNDGGITNPGKILRRRKSFRGSTGLGLTIVQEQEKRLGTSVIIREIRETGKVVCSFPLVRA